MLQKRTAKNARRYNVYFGPFNLNYNYLVPPWIPPMWSVVFPGLGHLVLGQYIDGYLLFIWEICINTASHLNLSILYTFQGRFELAKQTLDIKWAVLYLPVYLYGIWDAHRAAVETNNLYYLAEKETVVIVPYQLSALSMNYLDKTNPKAAIAWSCFVPGLGHVMNHRMLTGLFLFLWWILICYFSNLVPAFAATVTGSFAQATQTLQPQWFLYLPSVYGFAIHDSYVTSVEINKLFKVEQAQFFIRKYQDRSFHLPTKKG